MSEVEKIYVFYAFSSFWSCSFSFYRRIINSKTQKQSDFLPRAPSMVSGGPIAASLSFVVSCQSHLEFITKQMETSWDDRSGCDLIDLNGSKIRDMIRFLCCRSFVSAQSFLNFKHQDLPPGVVFTSQIKTICPLIFACSHWTKTKIIMTSYTVCCCWCRPQFLSPGGSFC